jgi:hypothetical protein
MREESFMKKVLAAFGSCLLAVSAYGAALAPNTTVSFAPENDLHLEDQMFVTNVTEEMFNKIIDAGYAAYLPFAQKNREKLKINRNWDDSTVNANVSRFFGTVTINMYGGLARRPEVSPAGFALVLCHELGHAYGGQPYLQSWQKIAAEGQADYYGAGVCLKTVLQAMADEIPGFEPSKFIKNACKGDELCMGGLYAGEGLGALLAAMKNEPTPNYETPDTTVVEKTELSYPATVQCRMDTYFAGTMNQSRPKCWYAN